MAPVRGLLHRKELVGVSRVKSVSSPSCPPVRWLTRLTNFDDDDQVGIRSNRRRGLMKLHIEKTWDGEPLEESDKVRHHASLSRFVGRSEFKVHLRTLIL